MSMITISLPDGISESEAKLLLAVKPYEQGRISGGKAAEMSGYSLSTFMELLSKQGIAAFDAAPAELADDMSHA